MSPLPIVIFSPLFAKAANKEFPFTASADTAPSGVDAVSCPALISLFEDKVNMDEVSLRTARPDPVPNHSKVSP